jgi:KUP system potassium uptake protein
MADVAPQSVRATTAHAGHGHAQTGSMALALGALGVVFGDIGTSPLYTMQMAAGDSATSENILGVLSLIFWSLTLVVTVKYLTFIMRADNRGEGGILALLALIPEKVRSGGGRVGWIAALVIAGAALLYGDGIITPAISVLSAIEGLQLVEPMKSLPEATALHITIAITVVILIGLFAIQSRGTGTMGKLFGPVMLLWFVTIGVLGLVQVVQNPSVLRALSPWYAVDYFIRNGLHGFPVLGIVVLCVTGGEALYADMGHFGARPIRLAWLQLAMPCLVFCYFGQGALLLRDPSVSANPFFALVPTGAATYALVVLATLATIIASQALISGVFSLTHQAVQLGFFPRVTVTHTSHEAEGQIYVPQINWGLAVACTMLVLSFKKSSELAAAYGIAVSGTMAITSVTFFFVTLRTWKWPLWKALLVLVFFLSFDIPFFVANMFKFFDGGYVPVFVAAGFLVMMIVWRVGRSILGEYMVTLSPPLDTFLKDVEERICSRIPGTGIYMASLSDGTPPVLARYVSRIRVLHEHVVLLTIAFEHVPFVKDDERLACEHLKKGFVRVVARYGFMEAADVPQVLARAKQQFELPIDLKDVTYYLGRETFLATSKGKMGAVSESIFAFLARNSKSATSYFALPPEQVVELGTQIDL